MPVKVEDGGLSVLVAKVRSVEYLTGHYSVGLSTGLRDLFISRSVPGANQLREGDGFVLVAKRIPSACESPLDSGHNYQGYYSVRGIKRLLVNPTPQQMLSAMQGVFA